MACASPRSSASRNSSKGVRPVTIVSWKAASALATLTSTRSASSSADGRPEQMLRRRPRTPGSDASRSRSCSAVRPSSFCVHDRVDALRPQAVGGAGPAEPAIEPEIGERDGVAVDQRAASAARLAVGERFCRIMAGRARLPAIDGQARVEEQPAAQRNGVRIARIAVAGIGRCGGGQGPGRGWRRARPR